MQSTGKVSLRFNTRAEAPPRTWLLLGRKAGDNSQVLALAEALGWPFQAKRCLYRRHELITNLLLGATLAGVDTDASDPLQPPWPDLIISAGRRNEPIARWLRRQGGDGIRLVHIGRPWASLKHFDLIITTPQYQLPNHPNILHNLLPLHRISPSRLAVAAEKWESRFTHLPRPWYGVLIGGDSGPFVFTAEKGTRLARDVGGMVADTGGSLLVTNSARTPKPAFQAFNSALDVPAYTFDWNSNEENPYFGFLALADFLVVTGESMSMLTEAYATGKPLRIFDLSDKCPPGAAGDATSAQADTRGGGRPWWSLLHNYRFKPLSHLLAMRFGPKRMRRDIGAIQNRLVASGYATWTYQDTPKSAPPASSNDLERAVERVKELF